MCSSSSSSNMCAEHGRGCNSFDCETNQGGVSYESSVWRPVLALVVVDETVVARRRGWRTVCVTAVKVAPAIFAQINSPDPSDAANPAATPPLERGESVPYVLGRTPQPRAPSVLRSAAPKPSVKPISAACGDRRVAFVKRIGVLVMATMKARACGKMAMLTELRRLRTGYRRQWAARPSVSTLSWHCLIQT